MYPVCIPKTKSLYPVLVWIHSISRSAHYPCPRAVPVRSRPLAGVRVNGRHGPRGVGLPLRPRSPDKSLGGPRARVKSAVPSSTRRPISARPPRRPDSGALRCPPADRPYCRIPGCGSAGGPQGFGARPQGCIRTAENGRRRRWGTHPWTPPPDRRGKVTVVRE